MSEALFKRSSGVQHEARSAGTEPADRIHPNVVIVMREIGIDLEGRKPQLLTNELAQWADVIVTMGAATPVP